jgi:hypothetical protein
MESLDRDRKKQKELFRKDPSRPKKAPPVADY